MGKKNKTQKLMKGKQQLSSNMYSKQEIQQMLSKMHLCKKCTAKIQKHLKTQKGGDCGCDQSGGSKRKTRKMKGGSCGCDQAGGSKRKMKGGDSEDKESYVDFAGKDGLEELDEDTDGPQEEIERVEEV
jgi:hypothetical protein